MKKKLHEVIADVVKSSEEPLSVRQIADIIQEKNLWFRPKDNKPPDATQVSARVNNYSKYFTRRNGIVTLNVDDNREDRLCKIVWNSNYWIKPMERVWSPSFIEDNKGYEHKHGFVHEDWLFNPKFMFDGYQYGYIRGVGKLNSSIEIIDRVYLFTLNLTTKERFYVGKLFQVERLQANEIDDRVLKKIHSYYDEIIQELKDTGADYSEFKKDPLVPNLRFKIESKELFPEPIVIKNSWFAKKYTRTTPMRMDDVLYDLFDELEEKNQFRFNASGPENKVGGYTKHTKEGITEVDKVHNDIERALYKHLLRNDVDKLNIACDTVSFGGKLADVVVKLGKNNYDIYEIKTDMDVRRGLREAIGQLLDYATWENGINVKRIYAVLPYSPLSDNIKSFIKRLKQCVHLNLEVWLYDKSTKEFYSVDYPES